MAEAQPPALKLDYDQPCLVCGYNLNGLPFDGKCPECGSTVQRSLQGNLLRLSAPEYLATLHRGVFLVQVGIVTQIITVIVGIAAVVLAGSMGVGNLAEVVRWAVALVATGAGIVGIVGWWLLSAPDPAVLVGFDAITARKVVRAAVVVQLVVSVPDLILRGGVQAQPGVDVLLLAVRVVGWIAWIVWFFAAMRYLRWLAERLPDRRVTDRARLMMWLGPLLYTVGSLVCVGPLVALVLYYHLLDWVREDLRRIRSDQSLHEAAGLPL